MAIFEDCVVRPIGALELVQALGEQIATVRPFGSRLKGEQSAGRRAMNAPRSIAACIVESRKERAKARWAARALC